MLAVEAEVKALKKEKKKERPEHALYCVAAPAHDTRFYEL